MKSWIWIFVISAVVIEVSADEINETCFKENNITSYDLEDDQYVNPGNNYNVKCFHACIAKQDGWMLESGEIDIQKLTKPPLNEVSEEAQSVLTNLFNRCVKKRADDCATAYFIRKCILMNWKSTMQKIKNLSSAPTS